MQARRYTTRIILLLLFVYNYISLYPQKLKAMTQKEIVASIDTNNHKRICNMSLHYLLYKYDTVTANTLAVKHLLKAINTVRKENGLYPYIEDPILGKKAQKYAQYMLDNDYYAHTDKEGRNPTARAREMGFDNGVVSEAINGLTDVIDEVIKSWMNSPGHRALLLSKELKYIGGGFYSSEYNNKGKYSPMCYWVLDFCEINYLFSY